MDRTGDTVGGLLGPLEVDIMELLWSGPPATPGDVRQALAERRPLAYTTVMTVMSRLYEKGLLTRLKSGRAFVYRPASTKVELLSRHAAKALSALSKTGAQPGLSYFVDAAASLDDDQLLALEREIARLRESRS